MGTTGKWSGINRGGEREEVELIRGEFSEWTFCCLGPRDWRQEIEIGPNLDLTELAKGHDLSCAVAPGAAWYSVCLSVCLFSAVYPVCLCVSCSAGGQWCQWVLLIKVEWSRNGERGRTARARNREISLASRIVEVHVKSSRA